MNIDFPPMRGVLLDFTPATGDADGGNQRIRFAINITDENDIATVRDAVQQVVNKYGVQYGLLNYPPVEDAATCQLVTAKEGIVVNASFRVTANEQYPYTVDGENYVGPQQAQIIEGLLYTAGRNVQVLMSISGNGPRPETTRSKAQPHGAIYANIRAVAASKKITPLGNALDGTDWDLDDIDPADGPPSGIHDAGGASAGTDDAPSAGGKSSAELPF